MKMPTNSASRMPATTMARIGTSVADFTGTRRAPLPLLPRTGALAPRIVCLDRLWAGIGELIEYRPDLSGLDRPHSAAVGPRPEPIGRRPRLRDYEVLYIVRADLDDDKVQDVVKRVNTLIERSGGTIAQTSLWGKRKLAYEVKHQKEGSYVLQDFQIGGDRVPELEAALKITEEVLRHLIVRKPDKPLPTPVVPPPAEVVLEPVAVESSADAAEASVGDREER